MSDLQDKLIESIELVVNGLINKMDYTSSSIGRVINTSGYDCLVEISGGEYNCKLPKHLHSVVSKDDIVVVQDLHNNNSKRFVIAKI